MSELKKCSRCRSEIELKYFAINRKGEYNKTCETCLNKTRKTKAVITTINDTVPLERTDTDFIDGETINENKMNTLAKLLVHLDVIRPSGDDVLNNPAKQHELMYIGNKRVELLNQIDELDEATQKKIGERYKELTEEHNKSIDEEFEKGCINSDDDADVKQMKSNHMMKLIGKIKMY